MFAQYTQAGWIVAIIVLLVAFYIAVSTTIVFTEMMKEPKKDQLKRTIILGSNMLAWVILAIFVSKFK